MNQNKKKKLVKAAIAISVCLIIVVTIKYLYSRYTEYLLYDNRLMSEYKFSSGGYSYVLLYDEEPETEYVFPKEVGELPKKIEPSMVGEILTEYEALTCNGKVIRGHVYEYKERDDTKIVIFADKEGGYYFGIRSLFWGDESETTIWGGE